MRLIRREKEFRGDLDAKEPNDPKNPGGNGIRDRENNEHWSSNIQSMGVD
ncbi:hypothetical protein [Peptoniphilus catoniae]|nr:hypothetical protein [Peptoniphilus catoniae]